MLQLGRAHLLHPYQIAEREPPIAFQKAPLWRLQIVFHRPRPRVRLISNLRHSLLSEGDPAKRRLSAQIQSQLYHLQLSNYLLKWT